MVVASATKAAGSTIQQVLGRAQRGGAQLDAFTVTMNIDTG
jgi:hypothetical protein